MSELIPDDRAAIGRGDCIGVMSLPFVNHASWVWSAEGTHAAPPATASTPSHYQVRMFRRAFSLSEPEGCTAEIAVSGDSRYLLYCNGRLIGRGPAKGDIHHHFYETYDLGPHLQPGQNVLAALVLDMSRVAHRPALLGAPCSIMTYAGGFVLEGRIRTRVNGEVIEDLSTGVGQGWKVAVDTAHRFQNENTTFEGYQGYFEHRVSSDTPSGWTLTGFNDADWAAVASLYKAERFENRRDPASPYGLLPRLIPPMDEAGAQRFIDVFAPGGGDAGQEWLELLHGRGLVIIPPHTRVEVIWDVGELTTAYPIVRIAGGAGSTLRLTYAEALRLPWGTPGAKLLGRQQSLANLASHFADESTGWTFDRRGRITGWCDVWEPAGSGGAQEVFEPLHWRAFRYIGVTVEAGADAVEIYSFAHRFTAYPYRLEATFACSDPRLEKVWRGALHTMRLCSHETFEDCPYYEQMQYAGDTMITSKIAMLATGDYRLSRQALLHFEWSRLPDGLTQSRYPSRLLQVIPSWSLHWITNIRDYVYCSGDVGVLEELIHGVRAVLDWFRRHGNDDGLPGKLPYWNITDWCPWWPRGVVPGADSGPTCIISAQYIVALDEAADLCRLVGDGRHAVEFRAEAAVLRKRHHARFWSETEGLYFDRPGGPELSQYGNACAILAGAAGASERERMMARFPTDRKLAPGSFFWWHAGFAALARCGAYERMPEFLGDWHEMVDNGLSTFVEESSYWRSLCHAWSAHPALEFMTRILGVTPAAPGFAAIDIAPQRCGLSFANGKVCTPRGNVSVSWRVENGVLSIEVSAPPETPVTVRLPGAEPQQFGGGEWRAEVSVR